MNRYMDFLENLGKNTNIIYRCLLLHSIGVFCGIYLTFTSHHFVIGLLGYFLIITLHFKLHFQVSKVTRLYQEVASLILDPTSNQFYLLNQKLNQDSEKLQQITKEKARKTMNAVKSEEFIKKYQNYHRKMKNLNTFYLVNFLAYFFGLRPLFPWLHLTGWFWQFLLLIPIIIQWFYPFYFDAWITLRNGRKLSIALLCYSLKKVIKQLDSDNLERSRLSEEYKKVEKRE